MSTEWINWRKPILTVLTAANNFSSSKHKQQCLPLTFSVEHMFANLNNRLCLHEIYDAQFDLHIRDQAVNL